MKKKTKKTKKVAGDKKKNPPYRPTKYCPEILVKAQEYLDLKMPNKDTQELVHSIEGLAVWIHINRETIRVWAKEEDKLDFSGIVDEILSKQSKSLINNGLGGNFESPIAKLMLTKHGYRDAVDVNSKEVKIDPEEQAMADRAIDEYLVDKKKKK